MRRILISLILALLLIANPSCNQHRSSGPEQANQPTRIKVRLLWLNQAQFAGIYAANEQGLYKRAALDVSVIPGGPGINPVVMVASGSEQIGIASATDIVLAREKGIPVRALAIVVPRNPTSFFAKKDSGIRSPADFVGKRVGVKTGFELEYYLTAMLRHANVPEQKVTRVPIQFDMTPFFSGDVQVWCGYRINEPNIAREKGIDVVEILPQDYGVEVAGDVIFTSEQFYAANPKACWAFVDATLNGWRWAAANRDAAIKDTLRYASSADPAHERAMLDSMVQLIEPGESDATLWAQMVAFLRDNGVLKGKVEADACYFRRQA